ncbi:hypothetical protein GLOIN_2v1579716 [Rhizophagus irregularis DAOM 181602=DAOM 197198]|nr:hypothetical protein GLOIN_2v1579716 [Rhizophagus irregularis DAOM 181602=DAOM 197198]
MITDKMEKHLNHTEFLEGRIINLIFGFKKSKQLNVTCCYLPSSPKNDVTKTKISAICVEKLNKLIIKSNKTKNSYAIVIGDFNMTTKNKSDPNYPSIRLLKNNRYKDIIKYHQVSLDNNSTHSTNRIDYHYGNPNLLEQSIHSYTQSIPQSFFNTDHNIVITLLEKTFFDSRNKHLFEKFMDVLPFNKRNDEVKKVFKYDQMTVELWSSYTNRSRSTFKNRFSKEPQQINNKTTLNRQWDLFEKTLIELKEHIIPQKSINFNTSSNPDLPLELRQMNNHVILLYQVKQFLNLKHIKIRFKLNFTPTPSTVHNIPQHIWVTYYEGWMKYLPRLKILLDFNKLPIILPLTVTPDNFISTKDEIYRLFHMMKIAYQSAYDKYLSNKISSYVTERNDNLQHDQTKMINSILNRNSAG